MAELCKHCNTEITLNYCPACGRPKSLKKIDGRYILHEIRSALSVEKGFLYTIRKLAVDPGKSIKDFLQEDRNSLVKPIVFLIVSSLIYSILSNVFRFEDRYVQFSGGNESAIIAISQWVQKNYGYANILMAFFIGLWLKLLFRKHPFNFYEILILLCFVMGMGMLIYAVFGVARGLTRLDTMQAAAVTGFIYTTYAIGHFFDHRNPISYLKAFVAYVIGMISFSLTAIGIGIIIDWIMKQ